MAFEKGAASKLFWTFLLVESFTLPAFRSGGRSGLTFWGWVGNHTIFGPPVEYVPEEDYVAELAPAGKLTDGGETYGLESLLRFNG